jgi:hypothetical protein
MIIEIAQLTIRPGSERQFEAVLPRRRALPGTKIRRRIEQRINDSGH